MTAEQRGEQLELEPTPQEVEVYTRIVERGYYVKSNTGERVPLPLVITPLEIRKKELESLVDRSWKVAFTKALLVSMLFDRNLKNDEYLQAIKEQILMGLPEITREMMERVGYSPDQLLKWRNDSMAGEITETNAGEPQADIVIWLANKAGEELGKATALAKLEDLAAWSPFEQSINSILEQWRSLQDGIEALPETPNVGFLTFTKVGLSGPEAEISARLYTEQYGGTGIVFRPQEIEKIEVHYNSDGRKVYILYVKKENGELIPIHMVRRLAAEPFEHLEKWEEVKQHLHRVPVEIHVGGQVQKANIDGWEAFLEASKLQMMNPLNSLATDKRLDALLYKLAVNPNDPLWDKLEKHMEKLAQKYKGVAVVQIEELKQALLEAIPETYWICSRENNSISKVNTEFIEAIRQTSDHWVIKFDPLGGHSGKQVFVGRKLLLHEAYAFIKERELLDRLRERLKDVEEGRGIEILKELQQIAGGTDSLQEYLKWHENKVANGKKEFIDEVKRAFWKYIVEVALKEGAIAQRYVEPVYLENVEVLRGHYEGDKLVVRKYRIPRAIVDIDPQHIDPFRPWGKGRVWILVIRVTSEKIGTTNVSGGYGGVGCFRVIQDSEHLSES